MFKTVSGAAAVAGALMVVGVAEPPAARAATIFGVTAGNVLFQFDSATPQTLSVAYAIHGFTSINEQIVAIDFRPATGQLYALGSFGQLYTLNTANAGLTAVGSGIGPINGTAFGFDFNPTIDRIRLTSNTGTNLVIDPVTGTLQTQGTNLFYAAGDAHSGLSPNVVGSAYSNSALGAAPGTSQLYALDAGLDLLVDQANNSGTLTTIGPLGFNTSDLVGFDIFSPAEGSNIGFASLTSPSGSASHLYTINLATGAATLVGQINGGTIVTDLAVVPAPEPAAAALLAAGSALIVMRRRP